MSSPILFSVEKRRVLVPVGEPCSFQCAYCYTRNGDIGIAKRSTDEIIQAFQNFARNNDFDIIQLGYDGDPFAHPSRGIKLLQDISTMGKHVNFSTKAFLQDAILQKLVDIQRTLFMYKATLTALISLSCWDSASTIEPKTPAPCERVRTIEGLKRIGVPTFVALRPILPQIPYVEYKQLIEACMQAGCDGFIPGPFYVDKKKRFARFIPSEVLDATPSQQVTVSWSAHAPIWTRYEDPKRMQSIADMITKAGGQVFFSSVDAIEYACKERQAV